MRVLRPVRDQGSVGVPWRKMDVPMGVQTSSKDEVLSRVPLTLPMRVLLPVRIRVRWRYPNTSRFG